MIQHKPIIRVPARRTSSAGVHAAEISAFARGMASWVVSGQYNGARHDKTALKSWSPYAGSADTDTLGDLATLRARSRDLDRNDGIARGARKTSKVNVVGAGLRVRPQIKRELLGLSEEQAETWQDNVAELFDIWASSKHADVTRTQNFYEMQGLAFVSAWLSGDCFALRRYKESDESFLALCLQLAEADRVGTPADKAADSRVDIRDGVQVDKDGAAEGYWFGNAHPAEALLSNGVGSTAFNFVPSTGANGQPLVIHLFERERIGLSRGVPALAPVIEDLKQLSRYSEAELMAAVVSAFFTVFIKTTNGQGDVVGEDETSLPAGASLAANQVALGPGSVVELAEGESIETANPNRPNANFEKFFLAMLRKVGVSLGIPHEVLIQHFQASYSASRAALEIAWQSFMDRRTWLARNLCQPVYQWFLYECVARGLIQAPGFLDDPIRRAAWSHATWIGPAKISLDETKDATAAEKWMNLGIKTGDEVTLAVTGGDYYRNQEQRGREIKHRQATGASATPAVPETPPAPKTPNDGDKD